jgi:hypothetical protein
MIRRIYNAIRHELGGISLGLGLLGLLLLGFHYSSNVFRRTLLGGFGFREGPQPTPAQLKAAVDQTFWWSVWHRLVPQILISLALISFGIYEAYKENKNKI